MAESVRLTIPSDPKFLSLVRKVVSHLLTHHNVARDIIPRLALCIDEACSNIIKYSYDECKGQSIEMCFSLADNLLEIEIRDYGKQCDPKDIKPRAIQEIKPGGLGTYFINEIMDEVHYCTNREKGTLLTMRKNLKDEMSSIPKGDG
jgi:anti-sigma regulatory factor (Ser/Thr protein kinase)